MAEHHGAAGGRGVAKVPRAIREPEILRQAGLIFAARGFHAASMTEIAERAGVSKPMVYSYFGSKEQLYGAYVAQCGDELIAGLRGQGPAPAPGQDPAARLHDGAVAFFRFVEQHQEGWGVLYGELASPGAPLRPQVLAIRRRVVRDTARLLTLVSRRALGETEAEGLALAFVGAGEALANWWLERKVGTPEDLATRLVDVGWHGLATTLRDDRTLQ